MVFLSVAGVGAIAGYMIPKETMGLELDKGLSSRASSARSSISIVSDK